MALTVNNLDDISSGRLLQRSLLPQRVPSYPGLEIAADVWTAVDLGGDYYQFLEQPGLLAIAIADSSGKSVAGAIHAALFKGQLDALAQQGKLHNPVSLLTTLNKLLCDTPTGDAIALAYGVLDLSSYELRIGNAGIPGPMLYRASKKRCEEIVNPATALGRYAEATFRSVHRSLEVGDVVVFYSDGLSEQIDVQGEEFGAFALEQAVARWAHLSAQEILVKLKEELDRFSGRTVPDDDVSIVVLKLVEKVSLAKLRDCPYQEAFQAWLRSEEKDDSCLLRGVRLREALAWAEGRELNRSEREFLEASQRVNEKEQLQAQLLVEAQRRAEAADRLEELTKDLARSLEAERQHRLNAELAELRERIIALTMSSETLYLSNNQLEALIASVIAGVQLKRLSVQLGEELASKLEDKVKMQTIVTLERVVYGIHESNRLEGHGYWVNKVRFSQDGNTIVSGSSDRTIRVWNRDGSLRQILTGHTNWVTSVDLSPDNQVLASASRDNTIRLWFYDAKAGEFDPHRCLVLKGHDGPVMDVRFSPEGDIIASASEDNTVKLWKLDGTLLKTLRNGHSKWVSCVAFSPNGKLIASGSADRTIVLWNREGAQVQTLKGHDSFVEDIAFDPKGQALVSVGRDRTVKVWNRDGVLIQTFEGHKDKVWGVAFSRDGEMIASASADRTIKLWDLRGNLLNTLSGHGDVVNSVAFSPDGKTLASASRDTTIKLWNVLGTPLRTLKGPEDEIHCCAVSPDGKVVAAGTRDRTVQVWLATGKPVYTIKDHNDRVTSVCFSPDGRMILTGCADNSLRLWETRSGRLLLTMTRHRSEVQQVAFRPDGQVIASCSSDGMIRLWDLTGECLHSLEGHSGDVYSIAFNHDGTKLVSGGKDRCITIWSWNGKIERSLEAHSAEILTVTFSPNGKLIASGSADQSVKLWDLEGKLIKTLNGHSAEVHQVAFHPEGTTLASVGEDHLVQFWSLDGTLLRSFSAHTGPVKGVCFSPNGKTLISASADLRVIMWNLDLENLLTRGCSWLQEYLRTSGYVSEQDRRTCLGGCSWFFKYLRGENTK